ncbi:MAG TPA: dual specificity protein phosphatase family protein [Sphingomicrobium sp.]
MATAGNEAAAAADDQEEWEPNFHWLTDQLALGGSFPMERAAHLAEQHGISAVVDLRQEACDDKEQLSAAGIDLLHLPTPDLEPATKEHLDRGVDYVRERLRRGEKVLIHCQHGIGRSALLALCVLVDNGWAPLDALSHAKNRRWVVSPSESQYRGWAGWLRSREIAVPDYHTFGCIAYRHLANA